MDKMEMSKRQEQTVAQVTGGRRTKGSGSQWTDQTDVRQHHFDAEFAFAVECKSTGGQSIAVSREMIEKAVKQADGERPAIALRIYANDRYDVLHDWVAITLQDFHEMLQRLNVPPLLSIKLDESWEPTPDEKAEFERLLGEALKGDYRYEVHTGPMTSVPVSDDLIELRAENAELWTRVHRAEEGLAAATMPPLSVDQARLTELELDLASRPTVEQHAQVLSQYANAEAARRTLETQLGALQQHVQTAEAESPLALAGALGAAQNTINFQRQIIGALRTQAEQGSGRRNELERTMAMPPPLKADGTPKLPWTVVFKETDRGDGKPRIHQMHYDPTGAMTAKDIDEGVEVRVGPIGAGAERALFVDGTRIRYGQLYIDGVLHVTVDADEFAGATSVNQLDQN